MTEAERLLLLLVADALLAAFDLPDSLRQRLAAARHAIDAEAHAARQSALQAGQGAPRSSGSGETLDAASGAHSPRKGIAPLPTSPDGVSELEWWNDNGVLRPGTGRVVRITNTGTTDMAIDPDTLPDRAAGRRNA